MEAWRISFLWNKWQLYKEGFLRPHLWPARHQGCPSVALGGLEQRPSGQGILKKVSMEPIFSRVAIIELWTASKSSQQRWSVSQ